MGSEPKPDRVTEEECKRLVTFGGTDLVSNEIHAIVRRLIAERDAAEAIVAKLPTHKQVKEARQKFQRGLNFEQREAVDETVGWLCRKGILCMRAAGSAGRKT